MRLIDLEPAWLSPDVFIFRNPTGGNDWLTCKRVPMTLREQYKLINSSNPDRKGAVVGTKANTTWQWDCDDFNKMTVKPSIDASASGNWHGHITNGEIVGGL